MTSRYRLHPELRLTELEGEREVLHLGRRFSVSESGLLILRALETPRTEAELVRALCASYDVTPEHAAVSVRAFLARCIEMEALLVDEDV